MTSRIRYTSSPWGPLARVTRTRTMLSKNGISNSVNGCKFRKGLENLPVAEPLLPPTSQSGSNSMWRNALSPSLNSAFPWKVSTQPNPPFRFCRPSAAM